MEINTHPINSFNSNAEIKINEFSQPTYEEGYEIQEIISIKPPFIVRWGIVIFLVLLLILSIIAWFIQYPDIIITNGELNSINGPKGVLTKSEGKLTKLFASENQHVEAKDILGFIESTGNHEKVIELSHHLDTMLMIIQRNSTEELLRYSSVLSLDNLGELQSSFQIYTQSHREFLNYLKQGFYIQKEKMLNEDNAYLRKMHDVLLQQQNILEQDFTLSDTTFKANEILKNQNVIAPFEYRQEKSKLLAKQMTLPQIETSIINNENLQHEKRKEIAELQNRISQQKGIFLQALNTFISQVDEWKRKYILTAPVSGTISFATFIQENQQLKNGQLICFVNPPNSNYYVESSILQYNFGKVKEGQIALLKFAAYPYEEFGSVTGKIAAINKIPSDSGFLAKIQLTSGLTTNFNKPIQFREGLTLRVEIVTQNKRLLQRLFEKLVKTTDR